jgi:hypothetical protein
VGLARGPEHARARQPRTIIGEDEERCGFTLIMA